MKLIVFPGKFAPQRILAIRYFVDKACVGVQCRSVLPAPAFPRYCSTDVLVYSPSKLCAVRLFYVGCKFAK